MPDPASSEPRASSRQYDCDVAVVGAGPAGCAAALALAERGVRVVILEKAVLPRHKTCGGGVLRRALDRLPVDASAAIERECRAAELVHHAPALRFVCERTQPVVSMVMRARFDLLLATAAQRAGAELVTGAPVTGLVHERDAVRLTTAAAGVRARFVIAADGAASTVARLTGRPELDNVVPALECEVTLEPEAMKPFAERARFDFGVVPAGYAWVFPKREHLSIGVLTTRKGAAHLPECYRRYLALLGIGRIVREERHGYVIPCQPRRGAFDVPRVLFAGDAAGLADPILCEGISAGILSGQLAARAIVDGGFDDSAARRGYRTALEHGWLGEMRVARRLAWVLYRCPRVRGALLARSGRRASEFFMRLVCGETSYRAGLRRPGSFFALLRRS
jgi:geranylgeranyl reductase family protein